jgi:hypothetical protein
MKLSFLISIVLSSLVFADTTVGNYKISADKKSVIFTESPKVQIQLPVLQKCGNPPVGKPEIFSLNQKGDDVFVAYGHCTATIKTKNHNKIECTGCD